MGNFDLVFEKLDQAQVELNDSWQGIREEEMDEINEIWEFASEISEPDMISFATT
jgi:hypothetical protein